MPRELGWKLSAGDTIMLAALNFRIWSFSRTPDPCASYVRQRRPLACATVSSWSATVPDRHTSIRTVRDRSVISIRYSKRWSVRNRDRGVARLDF